MIDGPKCFCSVGLSTSGSAVAREKVFGEAGWGGG